MRRVCGVFVGLVLLLSACRAPQTSTPQSLPTQAVQSTLVATHTLLPGLTPSATATISPTPTPTPIPTPTLLPERRLPPETWRTWPDVIPISNTARAIYLRGLAAGRDLHAFSVIGDTWWVYPEQGFDWSGAEAEEQEAALWYWASFGRRGAAWLPGLTPQALFLPERADLQFCAPGELPIDCELRAHHSILAFVHFQNASKGMDAALIERRYRAILDRCIALDVLPVLVLNARLGYEDDLLNDLLARLAYEYDLPVWNLAAVYARQDPFNRLSVLEVLAALNEDVQDVLAAAPSAQQPFVPQLPNGISQKLVLGVRQRLPNEGAVQDAGVFLLDFQTQQRIQLLGIGYGLQAVAPDGRSLLANEGQHLWQVMLDGGQPRLWSETLAEMGEGQRALWLADGSGVLAVLEQNGQRGLWRLAGDGQPPVLLSPPDVPVLELYALQGGRVYWASADCAVGCPISGVWVTSLTGGDSSAEWSGLNDLRLSPDGAYAAYRFLNHDGRSELGLMPFDRSWVWRLTMPGDPIPNFSKPRPLLTAFDWSPNGQQLASLFLERSFYSGTLAFNRLFLADVRTLRTSELPFNLSGQEAELVWSPEGSRLAISATRRRADTLDFVVGLRVVTLKGSELLEVSELDALLGFQQPDFVYVSRLLWLPPEE